jgi:hypothetical protein
MLRRATIQDIQQLKQLNIEGCQQLKTRYGFRQWPLKLKIKNGLDGMTPETFNQSSICKKFWRCAG